MKTVLWAVLAFCTGAAITWMVIRHTTDPAATEQQTVAASGQERPVLYYRHPHSPRITSDKPMKDEMGMDYIPIYADDQEVGAGGVRIAPEVVQNLGIRTAMARRASVAPVIEAYAIVDYDEKRLSHVHVRAEGWIEDLTVRSLGERIKAGQLLFTWYAPQLVTAQEEYLRVARLGQNGLRQAAADRLISLGIAADTVARLERQGRPFQAVPVYAPADGVVTQIGVRDGMYVTPAEVLMTLADLSSAWVYVDLFENQARDVAIGQPAQLSLAGYPDRLLVGTVEFIAPDLDPQTRSVRARLRFENQDELLKPNMYGRAQIIKQQRDNILLVPRDALIRAGTMQRVVIAGADGSFSVRDVTGGAEFGDDVEIISGLEEGEKVVTSAQFLIDSESSLRASFTRMEAVSAGETQEPQTAKVVWGVGVYHGPGRKPGTISLSHDPIPAFGWPAMKMDLPLAKGVTISTLLPGTPLRFQLQQLDEVTYQVIAVEPGAGGKQP